ncbi:hypothetical protein PrNR1418_18160 [Providencia rettgeri]|nr:hypothetical protein PrNR1418_18160 [Providencia rettgeri]
MNRPEINQTRVVVLKPEKENLAELKLIFFKLPDIIDYFLSYHRVVCLHAY